MSRTAAAIAAVALLVPAALALAVLAPAVLAPAALAGEPADRRIDVSDAPDVAAAYARIVDTARDMCRESETVRTASALRQCVRVVVARTVSASRNRDLIGFAQTQPTAAKSYLTVSRAD